MRKSLAPSQVAKRNRQDAEFDENQSINKSIKAYSSQMCMSPFRKPLGVVSNNTKQNVNKSLIATYNFPDHNAHEVYIKSILSKPFKLPIPNYKGQLATGRGLGIKKQLLRKPLHDPFEENALILFSPPEISAHESMKMDKTKIPVHVVVDPILSKVSTLHDFAVLKL